MHYDDPCTICTDRAGEVDILIGNSNGANTFPGATLPFGMVQFNPEASPTSAKGGIACNWLVRSHATVIVGYTCCWAGGHAGVYRLYVAEGPSVRRVGVSAWCAIDLWHRG